ncbi:MAG TPA: alanine racemase [Candidatus Limnocylindrales bacterium]|nr:alanine racemase [Candidatus Limnocylindrales bacterium]
MTRPGSPHRAWIEVDHDAIRHNLAAIRRAVGDAQVIGVVKANAYGHGDREVARTLAAEGVERLAVATVDEARRLREAGIAGPILLLWGIGPDEADEVVELELEPVVYDARTIAWLEAAAQRAGGRIGVHLKVDTGLGRQGAALDEAVELGVAVARSRQLMLAGTMSHLAVPGEDDAHTDVQLVRMAQAVDALRSTGVDPGLVHVSASAGIAARVAGPADAVRPGLALYGLAPGGVTGPSALSDLRAALSLKARPLRIFDVDAGEALGYGLRYRARRATRIATLPIGYGDGWPRAHANNGSVLVRGHRAPIVGAVSMDGLTVDLGEIAGVTYDDVFVLIGEQSGSRITADDVAGERRTINYEVTTALRQRLPRLHLGAE